MMYDDDHDEIAQWAESLSPEGAPGIVSQRMREMLGDAGYEKAVAENDAAVALYLQKKTLINNILALVVVYGAVFGVVGFVAAVAFLAKFI